MLISGAELASRAGRDEAVCLSCLHASILNSNGSAVSRVISYHGTEPGILSDFRLWENTGTARDLPRRTVISNKAFSSGELLEIRQNNTSFILCLLHFNWQEIIVFNSEPISWHCYCWFECCSFCAPIMEEQPWETQLTQVGWLQVADTGLKYMFMLHAAVDIWRHSFCLTVREFILQAGMSGHVTVS